MKTRFVWLVGLILILVLALSACQPAVEEVQVEVTRVITETVTEQVEVEVPVEVTRVVVETQTETVVEEVMVEEAALGSADRPIKVLFVPSVEVDAIISGGEVLANALNEATGLEYEVVVPTSYAATIEEMCASPDDTVGFIPAQGYVLANNRCGVTVGAAAIRFGLSWYTTQYVVGIDSDIQSLEDLAGRSWCIPDYGSTSGYLYPKAQLTSMGIEPGEIIEAGGHPNAMLGVYNGDCDFATGYFTPPLLPFNARQWTYGVDDPEIWRDAGLPAVRNEAGRTFIGGGPDEGGYRLLDSRAAVTDTAPDIYDQTRVIALTDRIPNDTISFGPEFALNLANQIVDAMVAFAASDACYESICSDEFYNWTGVEQVTDSFYDPVRSAMDYLGITEEDILGGG